MSAKRDKHATPPHGTPHGTAEENTAVYRFRANWVAVVLTIVSIIQALALTRLADAIEKLHFMSQWSLAAVAFVVILRIFQTYVTAAVEYENWNARFLDLVFVFVVGLVEYELIGRLEGTHFNARPFELWFAGLCALALLGHANAYREVGGRSEPSRTRERHLQMVNMTGALLCFALTVVFMYEANASEALIISIAAAQTLIIGFNTYYSVRVTLGVRSPH